MKYSVLIVLIIASLLALPSCKRSAVPHSGVAVWGPSSYWTPPDQTGKQPLSGIDQGSLVMGLRSSGAIQEPVFMVWAGEGGGGQIAGKTDVSAQNPALRTDKFEGTLASVQITCQTTDGKTGTVTLGSETFQLEQGALFLISKNGPAPTIKQMKLARLNLKPEGTLTLAQMTHDYFRNLAKSDPDIQAFWSAADKSK